MSKTAFANLASQQLGFDVTIDDPYKVCDFKPLFGKIFGEALNAYQYWGYCDLDIVFGDILKQIHPLLVKNPDIISFYPNFLSGPFCLYKNTDTLRNLFNQCPDYKSILQDTKHKAFDEHIPKKIDRFSIHIYRLFYILKLFFVGPKYKLRGQEIRYQFQWYAKKLFSRRSSPSDMTDIVHKASRARQIKVIFTDQIRSDRAFRRMGRSSWNLSWKDGRLTDSDYNKDLFAFHFVDSKNNPVFAVESVAKHTGKFTVSDSGIEWIQHDNSEK